MPSNQQACGVPALALRPREAAAAIGVSERTLHTLIHQRGLPVVRLDRAILVPVADLQQWLSAQTAQVVQE